MTPEQKQNLESVQKNVIALRGAEDIFIDPSNWPMMFEVIRFVFSFFGSLFGLGKAAKDLSDAQCAHANAGVEKICAKLEEIKKAVDDHGHEAAELKKIFEEAWRGVAQEIVAAIPGEMMRMEIRPSAMTFQRKVE